MNDGRVPLGTKLAYGVGAVAYGIKENGFAVFLLIFYNQVVGLPADQVGLAILAALVIDAFIDPLIGTLSDRTHTRWGRRHPWLYGSALPIALAWLMLWNPPQGSQATILGYLLLTAILARATIATNEVPSIAMTPELTRDYHERTIVLRYRYVFGWVGGLAMLVLAYSVFLAPPYSQTGPAAVPGYANFALFGACAMAASVLVSAIGTHRRMARPPANRIPPETFRATLRGIGQAFSNRAFLILMGAAVFSYTNQGVSFAMSNYLLGYVWQFTPANFLSYAVALFSGVMVAFFIVGPVALALGKKHAAAGFAIVSSLTAVLPYVLRLLDLLPGIGSPWLLPAYLSCVGTATGTGVAVMILGSSMMADVVEASEERTGKREEGLFYAGALFMQKCTSGIGIFISGQILSFAQFPGNAVVGQVPETVLGPMTLIFVVLTLTFAILSALIFMRFPFGQVEHEARLAKLAVAAGKNA